MIKKGICTLLAVLPIQSVYAEPYVGVGAGYSMTTIEKKVSYNNTDTKVSDQYNSARAQLLIGYNFREYRRDVFLEEAVSGDDFFFAIEFGAAYVNNSAETTTDNWFLDDDASVSERLRYQAELFLLAKYAMQPKVTVFAGPGLAVGNFELNTKTNTAGNLGVTGDHQTTISGWAFKAGIEVEICQGMDLMAYYQYSSYETTSFSADEPLTGDLVTAKYKPLVNSLTVGVVFH